jgi:hypothetical protein
LRIRVEFSIWPSLCSFATTLSQFYPIYR